MKNLLWSFKIPKVRKPIVSDGLIYHDQLFVSICFEKKGFYESRLIRLDLNNQTHNVLLEIPHLLRSSGYIEDGKIYTTSFDGNLYCIDLETHFTLWKYCTAPSRNLNPEINSSGDHIIFTEIHGQGKYTYSVDKTSGKENWRFQSGSHAASNILIRNKTVFHGSNDSFFCIDLQSGNLNWRFGEGLYCYSAEFIGTDAIAVCSASGTMYLLDIHTGELITSFNQEGAIYKKPAVLGNRIFVGNESGGFGSYEFQQGDKSELTPLWQISTEDKISSSPVIIKDSVLFGCEDRFLYQVSVSTGEIKSRTKLKNSAMHILPYYNTLLILSEKGQVDCFEAADSLS